MVIWRTSEMYWFGRTYLLFILDYSFANIIGVWCVGETGCYYFDGIRRITDWLVYIGDSLFNIQWQQCDNATWREEVVLFVVMYYWPTGVVNITGRIEN